MSGTDGARYGRSTICSILCFRWVYYCTLSIALLTLLADTLRIDIRQFGQILCPLRCRFRHFRDKVHHSGFRHERFLRVLDAFDQIYLPPARHCIGFVCWEGRAKCPLRCVYWECYIEILRQVQAQCGEDSRNSKRLRRSRRCCGLW